MSTQTETQTVPSFKAVYAVPLECNSCVESVNKSLLSVPGVEKVESNLANGTVLVEGTAPPSLVTQKMQSIGKDAILRGSGGDNSAAVCILESFQDEDVTTQIRGLARIVSVGNGMSVIDMSLNGVPKGRYFPAIHAAGDLSRGALSTGPQIAALPEISADEPSDTRPGLFKGQKFFQEKLNIGDLIGRSIVVSSSADRVKEDSLVGVIARSAGVWQNDKQVCSCSGKTVWQERQEAVKKGIF